MSAHRNSIFPGLALIIIGGLLLIHKFFPGLFDMSNFYPLILMGLGVWLIGSIKGRKDKGAVFPGTIIFLLGFFYFLRSYDLIEYYSLGEVWPIMLIIVGLGFGALFITKPSDWGVLVPGGVLVFLGVVFLLREFYIIRLDIADIITDFWPIILIVIGGGIVLGSLRKHRYSYDED